MALVVWAATLEATRPRRGVPVLVLLALAGMLRPEAWFLAAMYWVLGGVEGDAGASGFMYAALAASGPSCGPRSTTWSPATRCSRCKYTRRRPRISAASARCPSCRAAIPGSSRTSSSCRCSLAAGLGAVLGVVISPRRMLMPIVLLRRRAGDVHRDRRRRRVGDRALPGRPGAGADGAGGGRDRRLDDARCRAGVRTAWMVGAAADRDRRRRATPRPG